MLIQEFESIGTKTNVYLNISCVIDKLIHIIYTYMEE